VSGAAPRRSVALLVATGLGAGWSPVVPGTAGTLVAVPPALLAARFLSPAWFAVVTAVLTAVAVWSAHAAAPMLGAKDPRPVVIDEVAGYFVTLLFLPPTGAVLAAAFFLFRLADVVKPFPARRVEAWPGGLGIVADDIVAGLYANLALRAALMAGARFFG
jgi:phosphatidylglycerophosphatase A